MMREQNSFLKMMWQLVGCLGLAALIGCGAPLVSPPGTAPLEMGAAAALPDGATREADARSDVPAPWDAPEVRVGVDAAPVQADVAGPADASLPGPTVVGGTDDTDNRFGAVVLVNNNCSGTYAVLPAASPAGPGAVVVTAGHCVCQAFPYAGGGAGVTQRIDGSRCATRGAVTLIRTPGVREVIQGRVVTHPEFFINMLADGGIVSSHADLALVLLDRRPSDAFQPMPITPTAPSVGTPAVVVGFGNNTCSAGFGTRRWGANTLDAVTADLLRISNADTTMGAITWRGDSGGACTAQVGGRTALVGVTSFGVCGLSAGYTNVATYAGWIAQQAGGESPRCPTCTPPPPACVDGMTRRVCTASACDSGSGTCRHTCNEERCAGGCADGACRDGGAFLGSFDWCQGGGSTPMTGASDSACFLTRFTGRFRGGGERVAVEAAAGRWVLTGASLQVGVCGSAACIRGRSSEDYQWCQGEPARDLGSSDGRACFLTSVQGGFRGGGEVARVAVTAGRWRLDGQSLAAGVCAKARCVSGRVLETASWCQGTLPRDLGAVGDRACFLTQVTGRFEGGGESVRVAPLGGRWVLSGSSAQAGVCAWAACIAL